MVSPTPALRVDQVYLQTRGPTPTPSSAVRGRAYNKSWPLLTLPLASNAKLATSAMTKIDQVSRAQHKHKLRCPHHLRQKRVFSVCPSFLPLFMTCIPCLFAAIAPISLSAAGTV